MALLPFNNERLFNLNGSFDEHLKIIEKSLKVSISNRGNNYQIHGKEDAVLMTAHLLTELFNKTAEHTLTVQDVYFELQQLTLTANSKKSVIPHRGTLQMARTSVMARGENQALFVESMLSHDLILGVGPAGTGKTYLAVAAAVSALEKGQVKRILLVRPAVEAGEHLGFLPGDLNQKIDPYLRPLYDALYDLCGPEIVARYIDRRIIEIAPLAYMRGRTLSDSFVILDEGQNATRMQMKMFLTRLGYGSKAVVTGDLTQTDLPNGETSGLMDAVQRLASIPEIAFVHFTPADVVRHPLVKSIIEAYENKSKH